jgi:hypothetical protein
MNRLNILCSILLFVFLTYISIAQENNTKFKFFASYDLYNQYSIANGKKEKINPAFSAGIEILPFADDFLLVGVGIEYQFPRTFKNTNVEFNYIPLYFTFNAMISDYAYQPIIAGRFGYNFFGIDYNSPSDQKFYGGFYFALGGGLRIKNSMIVEILYSSPQGTIGFKNLAQEIDINYRMVSLKLGVIL